MIKSASPDSAQILREIGLSDLPSEWSIVRLETLLSSDRGIAVGVMYPGDNVAGGVPLIRAGDLNADRVDGVPDFKISAERHLEYKRTELQGGELLISLVGNVGRCAIASGEMAGWNAARALAVLRFAEPADAVYVRYCLMSRPFQHLMKSWATTTVQATLNLKEIRQIPLPWPELSERLAIIGLLQSLDDKLSLNRKLQSTLSATADAIFKDWFVEFGPTRAKVAGEPSYLPENIWSLFPDSFDESKMPATWMLEPLGKIADFLNGIALQKFPATHGPFLPVIKIAQLRAGNVDSADKASLDVPPQYIVQDGDVLFSWSGSLIHRVWSSGTGALNQHLFKVTSQRFPKWYYFSWIGQHMASFQSIAASKATTMGHIQRHHLSEALAVVPDRKVIEAADGIIAPLFAKMLATSLESRRLAETRDLLLPKLISGEVKVESDPSVTATSV